MPTYSFEYGRPHPSYLYGTEWTQSTQTYATVQEASSAADYFLHETFQHGLHFAVQLMELAEVDVAPAPASAPETLAFEDRQ